MYGEIDVHTETFADQLQGWLIDNTLIGMTKVDEGDGWAEWLSEAGDKIRIDNRGVVTSIVSITHHDGRTFQTVIQTKEV